MEQQKLTNVKEALAFLVERFPKCFVLDGDVKPLKIGIFQDLASDLNESEIVSKRLLRMSLRHYTSGWKYLASVKEGNQRVDLLGELGDKVEAEHAQHAQEQLKESKAKAAQKRQEQKPERKPDRKPDASKPSRAKTSEGAKAKKAHIPKRKVNTPTVPKMQVAPLTESALKVGLKVSVKVGREPMPATVTDIGKDGVFVQLNSGMTVKVQQHQLRVIV
jgi:ProP effector